ncbi:MAG: hypothetical protein FJ279_11910 [Planctomycetes bacterium]|nr:hypothetical protein [Planctomycetota bacterium]MBM4087480.1 hypothetical protein [Planctomycetota bacterium]
MVALRAKYKDGQLTLLEPAPERGECEVMVIFPSARVAALKRQIELKAAPASHLRKLEGLVSWGGDALEDTERLYE